jgi:predicted regulator of Ras-like GTPase activity (Roadblock/LC7/MglB family)
MTELEGLLAAMGKQLDKAWILGIADNDGMLLASWQSPDNRLNPEYFAANTIRLIRTLNTLFTEMGQDITAAGGTLSGLEDIMLSSTFSYMVIRPISKGACYLLIDASREIPLGLLRLTASTFIPKLEKCLPGM